MYGMIAPAKLSGKMPQMSEKHLRLQASSTPNIFNIKGNDYRLIVAIDFEKAIIWIKWIGSHKDYDHIDAAKVEYG